MKIITRSAGRRLAVLAGVLVLLGGWVWWSMIRMPLSSFHGALPPLEPAQVALRDALRHDVERLARDIGERNVFKPAKLRQAADHLETVLQGAGYQVTRQGYNARNVLCHNLEAELAGTTRRREIVVVGAHYDSVDGSPGANDNGSGVAGLLALARAWSGRNPARTLRFVAFANEEPPFFMSSEMGSLVYAKRCRERREQIVAMLSLETIGYFDSTEGSQKYPPLVGLFYPSRGDFIGFVSNARNARLVRQCLAVFRRSAAFPSEGAALPGLLPGISWSDHWSFWKAGYPALMVTDTAPFRYPHYHKAEDTSDKIDYDRLARVVHGLERVVAHLADPDAASRP